MIKEYNKLVRDKIPEIIKKSGKEPLIRIAEEREYEDFLVKKLYEELDELAEARNAEEIADIFEVLQALARSLGYSWQEIEKTAEKKKTQRGGFKEKIVLISVKG